PRRHARGEAGRPEAGDGRGLCPDQATGIHGYPRAQHRARLPDADCRRINAGHVAEQDGAYLIMRHIISVLLENGPRPLSRVAGLFSQRNHNRDTRPVAATADAALARLTLTTIGQEEVIEQITKNLNKLIEVVKLGNLSEGAHIERELMPVKIKATGAQRAEVKRTTDIFRGQLVDVTSSVYTVQRTGTSDKLDSFIEAVGPASVLEVVRTGVSGIARGEKVLSI